MVGEIFVAAAYLPSLNPSGVHLHSTPVTRQRGNGLAGLHYVSCDRVH